MQFPSHLDHVGALPYFTEVCGYNGPVYMTVMSLMSLILVHNLDYSLSNTKEWLKDLFLKDAYLFSFFDQMLFVIWNWTILTLFHAKK